MFNKKILNIKMRVEFVTLHFLFLTHEFVPLHFLYLNLYVRVIEAVLIKSFVE